MTHTLDQQALSTLFLNARSHNGWRPEPVGDETLRRLYALARMGPTANNSAPARFVFIRTSDGRERVRAALKPNNQEKALSAPVLAVVAIDRHFPAQLSRLFPAYDAAAPLRADPQLAEIVGLRNASLQGAYLMMAARALGLDCGPMSGFDASALDAALFPEGDWTTNFLCALGYGDESKLRPRGPRLDFEEACRLI